MYKNGNAVIRSSMVLLLLFSVVLASCDTPQGRGAAVGAGIGSIAGALVGRNLGGAVIGAGLGALAGTVIADVAVNGGREVVRTGRPYEYTMADHRVYRAEPMGPITYRYTPDGKMTCRRIHETVWENGYLVKDQVRDVCESTYQVQTQQPYQREYQP